MYENDIEKIMKAQNGDQIEMGELITNNSGLIWSIVKRFIRKRA